MKHDRADCTYTLFPDIAWFIHQLIPFRQGTRRNTQGTRTFTYNDAILHRISVSASNGLELEYEFSQPSTVSRLETREARKDWWLHSKRLTHGALVCLLDARGTPLFCTVIANGFMTETPAAPKQKSEMPAIFDDQHRAFVVLTVVNQAQVCCCRSSLPFYSLSFERGGLKSGILQATLFVFVILESLQNNRRQKLSSSKIVRLITRRIGRY